MVQTPLSLCSHCVLCILIPEESHSLNPYECEVTRSMDADDICRARCLFNGTIE